MPHGMAVAVRRDHGGENSSAKLNLCPIRCYDQTMDLATKLGLKTDADLDWNLKELLLLRSSRQESRRRQASSTSV